MSEDRRIEVLLGEYQACHRNRNHYDSVRWTIGSIFMAASLALFAFSFEDKVPKSMVPFIGIFSLGLIIIWYLYNQHVNPAVMFSIVRFHEIEQNLREMGHDIRLHKGVWEIMKSRLRGIWITYMFLLVVIGAWILRIVYSLNLRFIGIVIWTMLVMLPVAVIVYWFHIRIMNKENWGERIRKVLEEGEKTEKKIIEKRIRDFGQEIRKLCDNEKVDDLERSFIEEMMRRIMILSKKQM